MTPIERLIQPQPDCTQIKIPPWNRISWKINRTGGCSGSEIIKVSRVHISRQNEGFIFCSLGRLSRLLLSHLPLGRYVRLSLGDLTKTQVAREYPKQKAGLDEKKKPFKILNMKRHILILATLLTSVTLLAEPATEKMQFESDTNSMSKAEVKMYMGRDPDEVITPHLWRYSGNFTSKKFGEGMDSYNTVDITFGMLTDSHKYGVVGYTWSVQ